MKWCGTDIKPSFNHFILIIRNEYVGKADSYLVTESGILKAITNGAIPCWVIQGRNGEPRSIPVSDIHGWCNEKVFATESFYKIYRKDIIMTCPHCGEQVNVWADATEHYFTRVPVELNTLWENALYLNWDELDIECDFQYICENCEKVIAKDLMSLKEMYDKQNKKKTDFSNDSDKVLDLLLLSKEEFLKSYSYITEEEYDNTVEVLKENIGKKGN